MQIRRAAMLVVSAVLLSAALVSIRGISYMPTVEPTLEGPTGTLGSSRYAGQEKIVELRADVSLPEHAFKHLEALNKTFMKQHPNIRVILHNRDQSSAHDDYIRDFRLGNAADILLMDGEEVLQYAVAARLAPVDDYYASDAETVLMPALVNQLKWNGYIWGIPFQMTPYVLAYHEERWQTLLENTEADYAGQLADVYSQHELHPADSLASAALLTVFHPFWLEELQEANMHVDDSLEVPASADEQERGEKGEVSTAAAESEESTVDIEMLSESNNEALMETGHVAGGNVMQTLVGDDALELELPTSTEVLWERLRTGEIVAMIVPLSEYEQQTSRSIQARLLPQVDGGAGALMTGQSFVISADSPYQQEAFHWIRSMSNRYHESMSLEYTSGYPVTMNDYELGKVKSFNSYPLLMDSVRLGSALQPDPKMPDKLEAVQSAILSSWHNDEQELDLMESLIAIWSDKLSVNEPVQNQ